MEYIFCVGCFFFFFGIHKYTQQNSLECFLILSVHFCFFLMYYSKVYSIRLRSLGWHNDLLLLLVALNFVSPILSSLVVYFFYFFYTEKGRRRNNTEKKARKSRLQRDVHKRTIFQTAIAAATALITTTTPRVELMKQNIYI